MSNPQCSIKDFFRWFNIIVGLCLVAFGIYQFATDYGDEISWDNLWGIIAPIYAIVFGSILIASEFRVRVIRDYLKFLSNYFGRGLFNIFLASLVLASLNDSKTDNDSENPQIITFTLAGVLFFIGVTYTCVYCCCRGTDDQLDSSREALQDDDLRS